MGASGTVLTLLLAACGASAAEQSENYFPIWGDEARAQGYSIPLPYGVNLSYMNIRRGIMVDSITFSGLKLGNHPIPSDMFVIDAGHIREKSKTENLRLGVWVSPFLNVYGLVGHTRGSSASQVSMDSDPSQFRGLDQAVTGAAHQLYWSGKLQDINSTLDFKGTTWGTGFTLAGGYGSWFGLVDTNYTHTDFDILDGSISVVTVSPRVGYRFSFQGIDGPPHLNLWIGSMYQDMQQEFKGDLANLHIPPELQPLVAAVNKDGEGKFDVKQKLTSPWNILIGAQYEVIKNSNVPTEFGFNERNSFFVFGEYRF